ncbi:MAG: DUF6717 family protein [Hyphomicrobiaceae bacterium]
MANAMMVIFPYRHNGLWVFDDEATGLVREPFVFGVPEMIDQIVEKIPGAEQGFQLLFSASPFPGYQDELTWVREEYEGNWYRWDKAGIEGWLCPALFKYFEAAPPKIYVAVDRKREG